MLKPLPGAIEEVPYGSDSPTVTCENTACGKTGLSHEMINFMAGVGSPGHPSITGFQCPHVQHWSCSPDCWLIVATACLQEHMHELIKAFNQAVGPDSVHYTLPAQE